MTSSITKKTEKCVYYVHGIYKRGGYAYVVPCIFDVSSDDHASFLTVLLSKTNKAPVFNKELLSKLTMSDKIIAQFKTMIKDKNFVLTYETSDDNKHKPAIAKSWSEVAGDKVLYKRPGISIPKVLLPDALFRTEVKEQKQNDEDDAIDGLLAQMGGA